MDCWDLKMQFLATITHDISQIIYLVHHIANEHFQNRIWSYKELKLHLQVLNSWVILNDVKMVHIKTDQNPYINLLKCNTFLMNIHRALGIFSASVPGCAHGKGQIPWRGAVCLHQLQESPHKLYSYASLTCAIQTLRI